ncbi:hypothetical protein [Halobacillus sp. Nhm2S1]|uniref:hypothetical protein n=1 Tax=Halobacillus sp. Nhm2S1 TaxID=2866716 RepID=UPI001C738D24|nr:hypothetical protein [Halobacillus sp. Nhm2S1]MBX0356722.1 hypothetical protein [Halobacillus sp. Nhm2S1]
MGEMEWDRQEVKRLKKKQLIHSNLLLLFFFILFVIYSQNGGALTVVIGICCIVLSIYAANLLYTLITGHAVGTKTYKRVLAFDIEHMGKKRWKRRRIIELIFLLVLILGIIVALFTFNLGEASLTFPLDFFPMLGGWIGMNIGQISRIRNLS